MTITELIGKLTDLKLRYGEGKVFTISKDKTKPDEWSSISFIPNNQLDDSLKEWVTIVWNSNDNN